MIFRRVVDNFKGMGAKWQKNGNVSCGSVVSIREKVVNVRGVHTLEVFHTEGTNTPERV